MSTSLFQITEHIIPSQHIREYPDAVRSDQEATLYLHVKQYTPLLPPPSSATTLPPITIVSTHGNGFPKESHEALWDDLLAHSHLNGFTISSIWIADPTHQGLSSALNEHTLSDDPSWLDHARDTLHMVNVFRSHMVRPIVGVGHSMGGAQLAHLAHLHPRLLAGLVLLDPVIVPYTQTGPTPEEIDARGNSSSSSSASGGAFGNPNASFARLSTYRRDVWPSRAAAASAMRRSPMFATWDSRAWAAFVKYALRDLPTAAHPEAEVPAGAVASGNPPVTLMTPVQQEVHTFMRPNFGGRDAEGKPVIDRTALPDLDWTDGETYPWPFYRPEPKRVWGDLPGLRPPVLFVLGGDSFTTDAEHRDVYKRAGTGVGGSGGEKEGKAKRVILKGVGHGVPFEAPAATAKHAAEFLVGVLGEWQAGEREWKRKQESKSAEEHVRPSEEWKKFIGPPLQRPKPEKEKSKI